MKIALIICTYMRPKPLVDLLNSINNQSLYPNQIIIVDGSTNDDTKIILDKNKNQNLSYYCVAAEHRGLTKQRNFGISKLQNDIEVVAFLDDDTILEKNYFENIIQTYHQYPAALGVGGYIINESKWKIIEDGHKPKFNQFYFDGWKLKENSRFLFRKFLRLDSNVLPGFSPNFSHGRSIGFLPPSGKTYEVEQLMGGVSSFKKYVFDTFQFSNYFVGYGLYEDADFTIRVSKKGKLYVNTAAQLSHYHHPSGRPNPYLYGKMVVRNGWYVWRIKCPRPKTIDKIKWHFITMLLAIIRFINIFTTSKRKEAFSEAIGRVVGWFTLLWDKPNKETKK